MKIFIDTAKLPEIHEACSWGIIDGLTTNPSLIRKAVEADGTGQVDMGEHIKEICQAVPGPVSLEVVGLCTADMIDEAMVLYERFNPIHQNVVIKIPVNPNPGDRESADFDGLKAIAELAKRSVPVNATLVMTPEQALLAAKAGARYVSPFMGRVDDYAKQQKELADVSSSNQSGEQLVGSIRRIFDNYHIVCEIIAASVRSVGHARAAAEAGAQIATIPFPVLREMVCHPKTEEGIRRFSEDIVAEYAVLFKTNKKR